MTLTELETFRQTIYSQYTNLKSTIDASTLITITYSSSTSVITYGYEVGPSGIGWAIPNLSDSEPVPSQPSFLPGTLTRSSLSEASTRAPTEVSTGTLNGASTSITSFIASPGTSTASAFITGTITSFSAGFTATELPGTTYTANGWITTTDSQHHTTLLPLITISGGRGIIFWDLPPIPNVEFIFPKFPNLPSLPRIHLPCVKIFGIHISGDCTKPPSSDGPPPNNGGGGGPKSNGPPPKSQPPNSQPANSQPTNSQPTNSQPTNSQRITSHSSSESITSSSSICSVTNTASNCMVRCVNTASGSSCSSYTTTCSQTITGCSVQGTTTTSRIRACSARPTPIPASSVSSFSSRSSSQGPLPSASTRKSTGSRTATNTATPTTFPATEFQTLPTTFKTSTVSSKPTSSTSVCVKITLIDCIYNYETVPAGQPCPASAAPPLPATCTTPLPFAGGSAIAPPPATTTSTPIMPTPTFSSQFCYPRGAFGSINDINSGVQNETTGEACAAATDQTYQAGKYFNWNATANNGGQYNFNVWWPDGCQKPTDVTSVEFSNICLSSMRNNYLNCMSQ